MIGFEYERALKLLVTYFPDGASMKKPTLFHSCRVGVFLWHMQYPEDIQIAGLLHDALEDTNITEEMIEKEFGKEVLGMVKANTKNKNLEKSEQLGDIVSRCSQYGKNAMIVKIADIYDNFLFYTSEGNISEIERCKILAKMLCEHTSDQWDDPIFKKITEILAYNHH